MPKAGDTAADAVAASPLDILRQRNHKESPMLPLVDLPPDIPAPMPVIQWDVSEKSWSVTDYSSKRPQWVRQHHLSVAYLKLTAEKSSLMPFMFLCAGRQNSGPQK